MFFDEDYCQNAVYWDSEKILVNEQAGVPTSSLFCEGYPSPPLEFPGPIGIGQAICVSSNVLDPYTMNIMSKRSIIYRRPKNLDEIPRKAYYLMNKIADTVNGHLQLCRILKRTRRRQRNTFKTESNGSDPEHVSQMKKNDGWYWEATDDLAVFKLSLWSKMHKNRGRHLSEPIREISAMQLLGNYHDHILGCIEVMSDDHGLFLFMPYCGGGCLYGKMMAKFKENGKPYLTEPQARKWFRQLLLGLQHLQLKGVCHRKISLENLMFHNGNLKIIDFDMSLRIPFSDPINEGCDTDVSQGKIRRLIEAQGQGGNSFRYMAPEVLLRKSFDGFAIDLWSVAIVLYLMLFGSFPFESARRVDRHFVKFSVEGALANACREMGLSISKEAIHLLQNMLWENPDKRLSLLQVMDHPWVKNNLASYKCQA